jgi:aldose sugar dehydrogenase
MASGDEPSSAPGTFGALRERREVLSRTFDPVTVGRGAGKVTDMASGETSWSISARALVPAVLALGSAHCEARGARVEPTSPTCVLVKETYGPTGQVPMRAESVVTGLEVPWGIVFISDREMLVTERPGRVRLVRDWVLVAEPVATLPVDSSKERGLLGIAAHPGFAANGLFYVYLTAAGTTGPENRVERWRLASDHMTATRDKVIIGGIPSAEFHDGGRLRFGPDGMLYVGTGDARRPDASQDVDNPAGKILRLTPDGAIPADNPFPQKTAFLVGIRNTQGFDWRDPQTLWVTDHGPSGDLSRRGHDEVTVAGPGANLGWPTIYSCETREGMVSPSLTWEEAVPPGGAAIYRGTKISEWTDSLLIGSLGSKHLHRVTFDAAQPTKVASHEVYLQNAHGRLREVIMGPDGDLYVTTSNCDGRGDCPKDKDKILRITR